MSPCCFVSTTLGRWTSNGPNLDVSPTVDLSPDTQDVLATSHTQHCSAHFLAGLHELVANNSKQQIFPIAICYPFLQAYDPFSTSLVRFIFPNRPNAVLEDVVVRDSR